MPTNQVAPPPVAAPPLTAIRAVGVYQTRNHRRDFRWLTPTSSPGLHTLLEILRPGMGKSSAASDCGPFLIVLEASDERQVRDVQRKDAVAAAAKFLQQLDTAADLSAFEPFGLLAKFTTPGDKLRVVGCVAFAQAAWYVQFVHRRERNILQEGGQFAAPTVDLTEASLPSGALKALKTVALASPTKSLSSIHSRLEKTDQALVEIDLFAYAAVNRILDDLAGQPLEEFADKQRWTTDVNRLIRRIGAELVVLEGTDTVPAGSVVILFAVQPTDKYPQGRISVTTTVGKQHAIRRGTFPRLMARPAGSISS